MQPVAEAVDVEERQREQESGRAGDLPAGDEIDRVGREVVVREDGAFRRAGGAGCVDDGGRVIAVERNSFCARVDSGVQLIQAPELHGQQAGKSPLMMVAFGSASSRM